MNRRTFTAQIAGLVGAAVAGQRVLAQGMALVAKPKPITVYKSSTCECCVKWVDHISANGFAPVVRDEENMEQIKDEVGVPKAMRSCHTAIVDSYLIEGHVPASDIKKLLAERPKVAGLAVPGMPPRTHGMAPPGTKVGGYQVIAFEAGGATRIFSRY